MLELKVRLDKKIPLAEFDKQIPNLVDYFPPEISVLLKVRVKNKYIEVTLTKNHNNFSNERWEWDLNNVENSNLEDYFQTIN